MTIRGAWFFRMLVAGALGVSFPTSLHAQTEAAAEAPASAPGNDSPTEIAKQNYRIGVAAFSEGRFEEAITAFLVADRLAPSAALSFNIARANDGLGKTEESLYWYGDYLRRAPEAPDRASVLALVAEREVTLAASGVQLLVVLSEPRDATVFVGETRVGTSPWHGVLPPGEHIVRVELQDHESWQQTITLAKDRSLVLPVTLSLQAPEPPPPVAPPIPPEPPPSPAPREQPPPPLDESKYGIWPWVAIGAGAVALGTAAGFELARRDAESDAETGDVQVDVRDALERMDGHQTTARVMLSVGVVFSALGGTLLYLDRRGTEATTLSTPSLVPAIDSQGFELRMRQRF